MRSKIGPSDVPGKKAGPNGSFPVGDPKHARLAIGGATHSFDAGNISKSTENHIKAEARAELNKGHHASGLDKAMSDHADKMHPVRR
jgi:hypothetical protein